VRVGFATRLRKSDAEEHHEDAENTEKRNRKARMNMGVFCNLVRRN